MDTKGQVMSKRVKVAKYTAGRQWMAEEAYEGLPVHIKRAQEKAVVLRGSGDNVPVSAHRMAFHYHSHLKRHKSEGLYETYLTLKNDRVEFPSRLHVDCDALFYYHGHNIVSVLRDKRDMPSPRLRFSLCGWNTKSTRIRLNRYAADLGVKFYCWRNNNTAWAIWVLDGTVFWAPMGNDDSIIATNS